MRADERPTKSFDLRTALFGEAQSPVGRDRASAPLHDQDSELRQAVNRFLAETFGQSFDLQRIKPRESVAGQSILSSPPRQRRAYVQSIVQRMVAGPSGGHDTQQLKVLLTALLRRSNDWDESALQELVECLAAYRGRHLWPLPTAGILRLVEAHLERHELSDTLRAALDNLRRLYKVRASDAAERQVFRRLNDLLNHPGVADDLPEFVTGEPWTLALFASSQVLSPDLRRNWRLLLDHAATGNSAAPRPMWIRQAADRLSTVGHEVFIQLVTPCLQAVGQSGEAGKFHGPFEHRTDASQIHEQYSDLLRGLIWYVAVSDSPEMIPLLAQVAERCFERIPRQKPRSLKVAVACITALAMYRNSDALQQLVRLQGLARQASIKARLSAAISKLTQDLPLTWHQVEEMSVPNFQLTTLGQYQTSINKHTATISIDSPGIAQLTWSGNGSSQQHSTPPAVKAFHGSQLASLRKRAQEINAELPQQRLRLERLLLSHASWTWPDFCRHYLEHPLVGPLARNLIWWLSDPTRQVAAIWRSDRLWDQAGQAIDWIDDNTRVTPWHPLQACSHDVLKWQLFLEEQQVCQPFKQAHRELYHRLPDETDSDTTSARMSDHFVEYFRLEDVAAARGWQLHESDDWQRTHSPFWDLPEWNLRATWATVPPFKLESNSRKRRPTTDSLSFAALDTLQPVPLGDIPELVYSEVMREIDCYFLQYGSIGNFGSYHRDARHPQLIKYWLSIAFGPLTPQGQVRQQLLLRLIPRSRLADRWRIEGDFLRVQGERNFYRIHLGSGQVRMGSDQRIIYPYGLAYTSRATGLPPVRDVPPLPFGGDVRLADLLRNAVRLMRESKITEQQLLDQLVDELPPFAPR